MTIHDLCIQAVFIDRDGTIGGTDDIGYPGELELYDGVADSICKLSEHGIKMFGFTINRVLLTANQRLKLFSRK
ncbi:hypothetical protein [Paenibacillus sp. QZ-Y1]|uniref:hypothetical protein n=1 Tax=Paenibacillus sp. QZ-Y1 TaxID=3414511 RepID=UPI003F79F0C1